MSAELHWIAFWTQKGLGSRALWALYQGLSSPQELVSLTNSDLSERSRKARKLFDEARSIKTLSMAATLLQKIRKGHKLHLPWQDYPELLANIHSPPTVLLSKGRGPLVDDSLKVGIVGSRRASPAGLRNAFRLAAQLASKGIVIVSGLARGIDTAALEGALSVGGRCLAVTGHGLHTIYPSENWGLAQRIAERGLLLSEHPPGVGPRKAFFPRRNRVLSGLCHGVLVVEANRKSGALITANFALEQGREVMAIPGPIDLAQAQGPLDLIQHGAALIRNADDVMDAITFRQGHLKNKIDVAGKFPALHREICLELDRKDQNLPELARSLNKDISPITQAMTELEIAGIVTNAHGTFQIARS
jgi:DNA processing protein